MVLQKSQGGPPMRTLFAAGVAVIAVTAPALAAGLEPNEIQSTFFTGQPFTSSTPTNVKFKMVFTADGKMTREPVGTAGAKGEGTWKLSKDGFCTTWKGSKPNCFRIITAGDNKWSVVKGTAAVATWTKEGASSPAAARPAGSPPAASPPAAK
jgi:hypothetical protein